jgi:gamma-glutamyltranspeptidase/glutathione hydrolase
MPAVRVAERGFPVTEDLFKMMNYAMTEADGFLVNDPNWAEDFAPDGMLPFSIKKEPS